MNKHNEKREIKMIGIDLAKSSFQLYGEDEAGVKVMNRKLNKKKLKEFMVNQKPCLVAMEACGTAHYWARLFRSMGHEVKLIPPQFVKPFVKSNKSDAADAEAICEAMQRPNMRTAAIKETDQQDIQAIHRMRSLVVSRRTAQINQVRGLLMEFGIEIPRGRRNVNRELPFIVEDAENGLSELFREELHGLYQELLHLDQRIEHYDQRIETIAKLDEQAQRLMSIPGVGPMSATALLSAIGDIGSFKSGRELAAWIGVVPRQHSTGGKPTLLGISKRGDTYLRQLLIHGARSVVTWVDNKLDPTSLWAKEVKDRRNFNIASVAMANKMIRIAYALLSKGETYQAGVVACRT